MPLRQFLPSASLVAQMVKNLPAMWETWIQFLGWEDLLEEGMATHFSILAWRIPMDRGVWQAIAEGVTKSWTRLSDYAHSTKQDDAVWLDGACGSGSMWPFTQPLLTRNFFPFSFYGCNIL